MHIFSHFFPHYLFYSTSTSDQILFSGTLQSHYHTPQFSLKFGVTDQHPEASESILSACLVRV